MTLDVAAQKLIDATKVLDAIRPLIDYDEILSGPFKQAWRAAFKKAQEAALEYVKAAEP